MYPYKVKARDIQSNIALDLGEFLRAKPGGILVGVILYRLYTLFTRLEESSLVPAGSLTARFLTAQFL